MSFGEIAAGFWLFAIAGGALLLAIGYAFVLLQRRRAGGGFEMTARPLQPSAEARAKGRALNPEDIVSLVAAIWLMASPWAISPFVLGDFEPGWLAASNATFGAMIAIFALAAVYRVHPAEELVIAALAVWIFVSPWVLGLAEIPRALAWSNWITAAIIAVAAASSLLRSTRPSGQLVWHR